MGQESYGIEEERYSWIYMWLNLETVFVRPEVTHCDWRNVKIQEQPEFLRARRDARAGIFAVSACTADLLCSYNACRQPTVGFLTVGTVASTHNFLLYFLHLFWPKDGHVPVRFSARATDHVHDLMNPLTSNAEISFVPMSRRTVLSVHCDPRSNQLPALPSGKKLGSGGASVLPAARAETSEEQGLKCVCLC